MRPHRDRGAGAGGAAIAAGLRARALLPSIVLSIALGACPTAGPARGHLPAPARVMVDCAGREVSVPAQIERIATNGTSLFSLLLALGAGSKIVAVTPEVCRSPWVAKILPNLRNVALSYDDGPADVERLLVASPTLAIVWSANSASVRSLEAAGLPVVVVQYRTPSELARAASLLGAVLGPREAAAAARFTARYQAVVARIQSRIRALAPPGRPKVYYAAGDPLTTEGQDSFVTGWIELAGGTNVAAVAGVRSVRATVSIETLLLWDPDVIIVRDAATRAAVLADHQWRAVTAVAAHRIYVNPKGVNAWCTRSSESLLQPLWAASVLHPDAFADLDLAREVRDFYAEFFGYRLNEAEVAEILAPP